ncbi:helix-turn-helix domain-containing protein [Steroidobacter denitrificans]|nr:AraC family transcriptional regulator [Steroidobacter denitrificans]
MPANLHEVRNLGIRDYPIREYPIPNGCSRFILPTDLRRALHGHALSSDLYTRAAGHYRRDPGHNAFLQACHVIYYCVGGEVRLRSDDYDWRLGPGEIAVSPPGRVQLTATTKGKRLTFYWLAFSGTLSTDYIQFIDPSEQVTRVGLNPELIVQFEKLCQLHDLQLANFTINRFVNCANLLKALLTSIPMLASHEANEKKNRIDLDRIRGFMVERLDDPPRLEEMARIANLSPYHFLRTFKKLTGLAPMRYFIRMRLQHACSLLETTQMPIKQISFTVGYADPQYFSRSFHQSFGMTPHAYRSRASRSTAAS